MSLNKCTVGAYKSKRHKGQSYHFRVDPMSKLQQPVSIEFSTLLKKYKILLQPTKNGYLPNTDSTNQVCIYQLGKRDWLVLRFVSICLRVCTYSLAV